MYWWEERGQGCLLVTESGDLDSTARVYRGSFRSIVLLDLRTELRATKPYCEDGSR